MPSSQGWWLAGVWRTLGAAGRGGDPKAADLDALAADVVQAPAPVMARSLHLLMVLPRHA